MAIKKKTTTAKTTAVRSVTEKAASELVHIQADERLVMRLKIITASRNAKMYEVVNEALTQWLHGQSQELSEIAGLFSDFIPADEHAAAAPKKKSAARGKSA